MDASKNIVGIDKLELNNLALIGYNTSIATLHNNCHITFSRDFTAILLESGLYVQRISIRDHKLFEELSIVCVKNTRQINVSISLAVGDVRDSNLNPLCWNEYDTHIREVVSYIESEYGIALSVAQAKVRYIEITSNLCLPLQYEEYNTCLRLLMSYLPANLSIGTVCRSNSKHLAGSIYRKNKTREVVVYDKLKQLGINNSHGCLIRLEIRINTRSKHDAIIQSIGTNIWAELNDNIIAEYFYSYFAKHFCSRFIEWKHDRAKDLYHVVQKLVKEYPRQWRLELVKYINRKTAELGIPYLLDICQIEDAVKDYLKYRKDRNVSRKLKLIRSLIDDEDKAGLNGWESLCQGNMDKIAEIFKQIETNYDASITDASENATNPDRISISGSLDCQEGNDPIST